MLKGRYGPLWRSTSRGGDSTLLKKCAVLVKVRARALSLGRIVEDKQGLELMIEQLLWYKPTDLWFPPHTDLDTKDTSKKS